MASAIVQYVVVRGDLLTTLKWPTGAVIAQACHATTSVLQMYREDQNTINYVADLDRMHKIVLKSNGEEDLRKLAEDLQEAGIQHKLWIEQPENFPTCLATKPYPKEVVQKYFKKFKLFK